MKKTYHIYAILNSEAYIGSVVAETEEDAVELGESLAADADLSLCTNCELRIDTPEVVGILADVAGNEETKQKPNPLSQIQIPERSKKRKEGTGP